MDLINVDYITNVRWDKQNDKVFIDLTDGTGHSFETITWNAAMYKNHLEDFVFKVIE